MAQRQDPFYPAIALLTTRPLAPFPPQHAEAVGALRHIVGGFDPRHVQEYPQRLACALQTPRKRPGYILPCGVVTEQMPETRIPNTEAHRSCIALRLAPTIPAISPIKPVSRGP